MESIRRTGIWHYQNSIERSLIQNSSSRTVVARRWLSCISFLLDQMHLTLCSGGARYFGVEPQPRHVIPAQRLIALRRHYREQITHLPLPQQLNHGQRLFRRFLSKKSSVRFREVPETHHAPPRAPREGSAVQQLPERATTCATQLDR